MTSPAVTERGRERPELIRAVPVRHPGRWATAAVIAVLAAMFVHAVITNPNFGWSLQGQYAFTFPVLRGVVETLKLTALAMIIGVVLGIVFAIMRLSPNPIVSGASWLYIYVFRGIPIYVQLLLWANIGALYKYLSVGIPFGPEFAHAQSIHLVPNFMAALLGLGLNEAAYMAEIVRAGILSVDEGQTEAASALGMSRMKTMRRIVLPQAMRIIVPPTGNETISMLKTTSLVVVVPYYELLFQATAIGTRLFQPMPMLIMASLWYLAMSSILMVAQYYIERYYARGSSRALPPTPVQRVRARFAGRGGGGEGRR